MKLSLVSGADVAAGMRPFESGLDRSGRRALRASSGSAEFVRDQIIAREGEIRNDLLVVSGGVIKLWNAMADGRRQIAAFRVSGDVISMHSSGTPWPVTVQAVTPGSLQVFPWEALRGLAARYGSIERLLLDLAGDEIASLHSHLLSLGRRTTEEKLASFLLDACRPMAMQSRRNREFHLPMRRSDIADYLGLTTESISREFSRLKRQGVISMPKPSRVVLLNRSALEAIAAGIAASQSGPDRRVGAG